MYQLVQQRTLSDHYVGVNICDTLTKADANGIQHISIGPKTANKRK